MLDRSFEKAGMRKKSEYQIFQGRNPTKLSELDAIFEKTLGWQLFFFEGPIDKKINGMKIPEII